MPKLAASTPILVLRFVCTQIYIKGPTWQETLRLSRERLIRTVAESSQEEEQSFRRANADYKPMTPVVVQLAHRKKSKPIKARVAGLTKLYVGSCPLVTGDRSYVWLQNPRLIQKDGNVISLLEVTDIAGRTQSVTRFGGLSNREICYPLDEKYEWFEAEATAAHDGGVAWVDSRPRIKEQRALASGRAAIWKQLAKDFGSSTDSYSQSAESADGIWATDWTPGDFVELAERYAQPMQGPRQAVAMDLAKQAASAVALDEVRSLYAMDRRCRVLLAELPYRLNPPAIKRAIDDLSRTFPEEYKNGTSYLQRLGEYEKRLDELNEALSNGKSAEEVKPALDLYDEIVRFQQEVLLSNPILDSDRLLFIKHRLPRKTGNEESSWYLLGWYYNLPPNWSSDFRGPGIDPRWDHEICALSIMDRDAAPSTLFEPEPGRYLQHLDLHFDTDRMLFSMAGTHGRWQVFEIESDGTGLRQVTPGVEPDVDNGDACYLPDGRIIFTSTRGFHGVPCEGGAAHIANICIMDPDGANQRMLTFDQETNFHPAVLNNGRIVYLRYEYADTSHQFGGLLFHMNPDGTGQMEYYGSNSYWPNRIFFPRAVPDHPTKVVGIVTGHHAVARMGKLIIFDPAKGRDETNGVVQAVPGFGKKVEPMVNDGLYTGDWPKCLHPHPLNDKYILVAARLTEMSEFGIYLADVFDNFVLIKEMPGCALFEPIPDRKTERPPVVPDKVTPSETEAVVQLMDVYQGKGMEGVPRGAVKRLRLLTYNYLYRHRSLDGYGGLATPGVDGPWEPRYVLGTVPVNEDGSAVFKVPANTPISVQPLDSEGRALQLMRSWFTAMPGEVLSCVGCHESQNSAPPNLPTLGAVTAAVSIEPWRGPARGFDFEREVQPVLDRYCVGCHDASSANRIDLSRKSDEEKAEISRKYSQTMDSDITAVFTPAYLALQPHIRRPGAESNYRIQVACEFAADTSPLIQTLEKGHHGVRLDAESWDRLYTWIDLGGPDHGTWTRFSPKSLPRNYHERRLTMHASYANRHVDHEVLPPPVDPPAFIPPPEEIENRQSKIENPSGWPFDAAEAKQKQTDVGLSASMELPIGNGQELQFALVPAGEFVMGHANGAEDEASITRVSIETPFYMSRCEISNEQYRAIVPGHNSGRIGHMSINRAGDGYDVNGPKQPVVRVSWREAMAFCETLAEETGERVTLPNEAQWEWACRAGSDADMWYGEATSDFSRFENLADRTLQQLAASRKPKWFLRDDNCNDNGLVTVAVGSYQPNPWGLHDMHGNACEWTRTTYRPYPYSPGDGRDSASSEGEKVVRGGHWFDRPSRAKSAFRWEYPPWRKVHNVGFRVIVEVERRESE